MKVRVLVIPAVVALTSGSAFASNLACSGSYGFRVDVNGTIGNTVCASTAQDVLDAAKDLKNLIRLIQKHHLPLVLDVLMV